jgi:tetratricopeptide (TPR) repeat protein
MRAIIRAFTAAVLMIVAMPQTSSADEPGRHPAYLHALTDLRTARWELQKRGGDPVMQWDESEAIKAIDACIKEVKLAAIDDGKDITDHPKEDAGKLDRGARLHDALRLLTAAHHDIREKEDNSFAKGLRDRATGHLDRAIKFVEKGIGEAEHPVSDGVAPGAHPAYLHALTDLRVARWELQKRGGDPEMKWDEAVAIAQIDACIGEIKKAAIDDGKDLNDHPKEDAGKLDRRARLHDALKLLRNAHKDINEREDNLFAKGLRDRALAHLNKAISFTEQGIADAER